MSTHLAELKKIASLAYLDTQTDNATQLLEDVDAIMKYVEQLRPVDTSNTKPMLHPLDLYQRLRADEVTESNRQEALANLAPLFVDGLFLVPQVIDKG